MSNSILQPSSFTLIGEEARVSNSAAPGADDTGSSEVAVKTKLKPGRMVLLLRDASDERSLLSTYLKESELVTRRVGEKDAHHGELTVRETLKFAAKHQGVQLKRDQLIELAKRMEQADTLDKDTALMKFIEEAESDSVSDEMLSSSIADYYLKFLGLEGCADKKVGSNDEVTQGISRGQRRLLSIGEVLVGPSTVLLIEESSIALDSLTSNKIVNCIRHHVNDVQGAAVISLSDPTPESYEHFDDIILIREGKIVFQGARECVLEFFESHGFTCPLQAQVTDFLLKVTSQQTQNKYWTRRKEPYKYVSVTDFAAKFRSSDAAGEGLSDVIRTESDRSNSRSTSSIYDSFKFCIYENFLLLWRQSDLVLKILLSILIVFLSLIFRKAEVSGDNQNDAHFVSIIPFVATTLSNGIPDIDHILMRLSVFFKQRDLRFFSVWIYCSSIWILDVISVLVHIAIWNLIFLAAGFDSHVLRLLKWNLPLLLLMVMASALLRLVASFVRRKIWSSNIWSFLLNLAIILHRYAEVAVRDNWAWAHWLSPTVYAQNEYHSGVQDEKFYWHVSGVLFGFYLLFNFIDFLDLYLLVMPKSELAGERDPEVSGPSEEISSGAEMPKSELAGERDPEVSGLSVEISSGAENPRTPSTGSNNGFQDTEFRIRSITFKDIRCVVNVPPEMKDQSLHEDLVKILKGVSGVLRPGVLTALMDVSKKSNTTLMDVLAGRITGGHLQGSIRASGHLVNQETLSLISGFCGKEDIHTPYITVLETLRFTAIRHLDPATENIEQKIHTVLELVQLTSLKGEIVGSTGVNGISIEQRKRLAFAVALLTTESVLFIDEPTSDLDARAAAKMMNIIRKISNTGCIVVCTIHQPSIDVLQSFDELILLQEGHKIYAGPVPRGQLGSELNKHVEGIDDGTKIGEASNLADCVKRMVQQASRYSYADHYDKSKSYRENSALIKQWSATNSGLLPINRCQPPFLKHCKTCLWKQSLSYWRNIEYNIVRLVMPMVEALVVGIIFHVKHLGSIRETEQDILIAIESLFTLLLCNGSRNALTLLPVVSTEIAVFFQERAARTLGHSLSFAIGQVLVELIYVLLQTSIQGVIVYFLIGFELTVIWYWLFMFLVLLCTSHCGMLLVALMPVKTAKIGCNTICSMWYLFSGFIFTEPLSLSKFISLFWSIRYLVQYGLVSSQFGDCKDKLSSGKTVEEFVRNYYGYIHEYVGTAAALIFVVSMFFAIMFAVAITVRKLRKA